MRPIPLSPVALKATGFFSKQTNTFSANAARLRLQASSNNKWRKVHDDWWTFTINSIEDVFNGKAKEEYYMDIKPIGKGKWKQYLVTSREDSKYNPRGYPSEAINTFKEAKLFAEDWAKYMKQEGDAIKRPNGGDIKYNSWMKDLKASEDQYGYWFTDEGLRLDVDEMQHDSVASKVIAREHYKEYFRWVETVDKADYKQFAMQILGWIRVTVTGSTLGVEIYPGAVSDKAYRAFTKFVNSEAVVDEYLLDVIDTNSRFLPASRKQALFNDIKKQIKKNTLEADDDDDFECWISDDGTVYPLDSKTHGKVFKKLMEESPLSKEFETWMREEHNKDAYAGSSMYTIYNFATAKGWIRVAGYENYPSVMITKDKVDKRAYNSLVKHFKQYITKDADVRGCPIDILLPDNKEKNERYDKPEQLLKRVRDNIKKNNLEASDERKLGKSLAEQGQSVVVIYRACALNVNSFLDRDYVTLSKKFAIEHAEHNAVVNNEQQHVIKAVVMGKNVFDAYNPGEYFYSGEDKKGKEIYKTELDIESMDLTAKETKERITNSTVLYHGTSREFDKFSVTSERNPTTPKDEVNAIFFTDDPVVAYGHANRMRRAFGGKIRIIKVNLDFKNMYDATNAIKKAKKEFDGVFGTAKRAVYAKVDRNKFDGIAFRGDTSNTPEYVVFNPDIIKILNEDVKLTAQEMEDSDEPYGYWFTDKGEKLVVNSYKHDIVAEYHIKENYADQFYEYLEKSNIKSHNVSHKLYAMKYLGWIRWTNEKKDNSINVEIQKDNVATKAFDRFNKHLKDVSFKAIRLDVNGSRELPVIDYDNDTKAVIREVRKNINKTIIQAASDIPYGYWFTDKGEIHEVDEFGHDKSAKKILTKNIKDKSTLKKALDAEPITDYVIKEYGWIRVVIEQATINVEINEKGTSLEAVRSFSKTIDDISGNSFRLVYLDHPNVILESSRNKQPLLLKKLRENVKKTNLEAAINEPYGYWITPKGELLKVENDLVGHIGVLQKYSKANNYGISKEDWDTIDDADYWPVLSRGWIRIVFERFNDMGIEIAKKSVSPAAAKKLSIYIRGLKDKNFTIDVNKSAGRYEIDYEDTTSKAKILSVIEQNIDSNHPVPEHRLEASIKHNITITADNEIIDHSVEETIETWRTDTGLRLLLIYNGKDYFIREFSENNVMVNEQAWAFLETARQSLLGIVRLAQDSGVFFKRESEMTAEDTVLQRWEASDKKYAIELIKSDTGAMAVSNFIKGDITQAWHKVGTSYLGKRTEEEAMVRVQEDINTYKDTKGVTFKKVKAASTEKPRVIKKPVDKIETRTKTKEALPSFTETVKVGAAQILQERKAALKKAFALVEKGYPIPEAIKDVEDRDRAYVKMEISKKYARRGAKDIKSPRIEPPPSEHDRRMVGSYVVGLNGKGKPVRGMLLTQRKDKVKRHYGWIAVLNEDNKPSRIEVTNVTRTLTKPPKDLVKAYEYMRFKLKTTMSRS